MVDREPGRGERGDEASAAEDPPPSPATEAGPADEQAEFERAMEIGREVMRDHRAVLAALAK